MNLELRKYLLILAVLTLTLAMPENHLAHGQAFEVPLPAIPGVDPEAGLPSFVHYIYLLLLGIGGALAFTMIVVAGLQWSLSSVSPALQQDAKERIKYAIGGLVLLLSSFVILNTINPDLVTLRAPGLNLSVIEGVNINQPQQIQCPVDYVKCVNRGRTLSCHPNEAECAQSCLVALRGTCERQYF